jgi:hypothetical protein
MYSLIDQTHAAAEVLDDTTVLVGPPGVEPGF